MEKPKSQIEYDRALYRLANAIGSEDPTIPSIREKWESLSSDTQAHLELDHEFVLAVIEGREETPYEDPTLVGSSEKPRILTAIPPRI